MFQAENGTCKGPVAGVCEEQVCLRSWRVHRKGVWCERLAMPHQPAGLMERPGVVS